ncbi:hypothetical protein R5O24_02690 [Tenacibaculum maritimum]|uniref:hypothetical protein n=1 Tax=Tenacibaculum maritimum TaxID=107401 RepID=UPI00388F3DEF
MKSLNPYQIIWIFLIPTYGIARKQDTSTTIQRGLFNSCLKTYAIDKAAALKKVNELKGTLTKEYDVLFITDKQFELIKSNFENRTHNLMDIATEKQKSEMFKIK